MNTIETRRYEMLVRVRDFVHAHGDLFPADSLAGEQLATVGAAVTELDTHSRSKMTTARGGAITRAIARQALLRRLNAMSRTARSIDKRTPGLDNKFQVPDPKTDPALVTAGHVFARDAEVLTGQFIGHGMPPTFIPDLLELVERFERSVRDREAAKDGFTVARASITAALASGQAAVELLDVIVANHLRGDPVAMAVWERDRRVDYRRRTKPDADAEPAVPAAEPAPDAPKTT